MDDYHELIRPLRTIRALIPNEEIMAKYDGKGKSLNQIYSHK